MVCSCGATLPIALDRREVDRLCLIGEAFAGQLNGKSRATAEFRMAAGARSLQAARDPCDSHGSARLDRKLPHG